MRHPRQQVKRIRDELIKHFDNEMRVADLIRKASLTAEEGEFLFQEMLNHPHFVVNVKPTLSTIKQTFEAIREGLEKGIT